MNFETNLWKIIRKKYGQISEFSLKDFYGRILSGIFEGISGRIY